MESNKTQTATYHKNSFEFANNFSEDDDVQARLNTLLELNRETANENSLFKNIQEELAEKTMAFPIKTEKAYALFGLLLGTFPPMAMFSSVAYSSLKRSDDFWLLFVLFLMNSVCSVVGYFAGKFVGRIMAELERKSWLFMLSLAPFVGILWGIMAGGAGGLIFILIGAIVGGIIAAIVGGSAFPVFSIFHRLMKKGDSIERDHFLPIAFGITFIISAFILSLNLR